MLWFISFPHIHFEYISTKYNFDFKMDIDFDDVHVISDDEDADFQDQSNEPWQCGLPNLKERVLALYKNGNFTDITLTFPGTNITYDAHRLILAISSPVFEGILYGPMRTEGRNVELHGDDPLIMEFVIAHCYGEDLEPPDMDMALEVYKLADKYLLDGLKKDCCKHIVSRMSTDNNNEVIEFAERFNFTDLKSNCLPLLKEMFEDTQNNYDHPECYQDEPDNTVASTILMDLNDAWIEGLLSEVSVEVLDFHESWKYPESPIPVHRLSTILSSRGCYLDKFYGCIHSESIHQFPLAHIPENNSRYRSRVFFVNEPDPFLHHEALELCLSVTDPRHGKRVVEAINQQNRFENNLIALHIRCGEVWPRNWSPIPVERTHRPSLLLISDADDDKVSWVVEAAKAFLPQNEGSYSKVFRKCNEDDTLYELKPVNILKLPRSRFSPTGFINLLQGLFNAGVNCNKIIFQSPFISNAHEDRIYSSISTWEHREFNPTLRCLRMGSNFFRKTFEDFPHHIGLLNFED